MLLVMASSGLHWGGQSLVMSSASTQPSSKKLVIVTGGSRGIGKATCLWLGCPNDHHQPYQVAVNYQSNEKAALEVVAQIESEGGSAAAFCADISDEKQVKQMFDDVQNHFGMQPRGLVNNAGVMEAMEKDITKITTEIFERDLKVNTLGSFICTKEFVKRCSTTKNENGIGGSIVVVSSVSAESAQILAYGCSKAACEALVAGLSKTLPLEGIRINAVSTPLS